ncbi:MAG: tripartite tricarboxylate transporter substrate-binding protein, partial [Xanthobacteraceae bacterium]
GLAVTGSSRLPNLPDVPTFAEAGLPKFDYDAWVVLVAPAHTPQSILRKLSADVETAIKPSEVQQLFLQQGVIPQSSDPDDVTALLRNDGAKYQSLLPGPKN